MAFLGPDGQLADIAWPQAAGVPGSYTGDYLGPCRIHAHFAFCSRYKALLLPVANQHVWGRVIGVISLSTIACLGSVKRMQKCCGFDRR